MESNTRELGWSHRCQNCVRHRYEEEEKAFRVIILPLCVEREGKLNSRKERER
uniref:Uncharacterized protein n=1 Tax=Nelumbo nucifera TaxID=4432 RepID=A0A822XHL4_NELNU|nr:TPA_asm: hypothetical protein HUJ06_021190 [Nelumbo nucifera]